LDTKNNEAFPLNLACPERLNIIVATQFATKEQLKDLTHMFYIQIHVTNYIKKELILLYSHIKIQMPFWDEFKNA
jgi:hypothetical protein